MMIDSFQYDINDTTTITETETGPHGGSFIDNDQPLFDRVA